MASMATHEPAKRPPSGGSENAAGSIHSATATPPSSEPRGAEQPARPDRQPRTRRRPPRAADGEHDGHDPEAAEQRQPGPRLQAAEVEHVEVRERAREHGDRQHDGGHHEPVRLARGRPQRDRVDERPRRRRRRPRRRRARRAPGPRRRRRRSRRARSAARRRPAPAASASIRKAAWRTEAAAQPQAGEPEPRGVRGERELGAELDAGERQRREEERHGHHDGERGAGGAPAAPKRNSPISGPAR